MMYVQKLITNRKVQEQQLAMANQATYLNQLALQNGMMAGGMNQMNLLGLYQRLHGMGGNQGGSREAQPLKLGVTGPKLCSKPVFDISKYHFPDGLDRISERLEFLLYAADFVRCFVSNALLDAEVSPGGAPR
ncbi:hypothetical protein GOODEAATRI_005092 [Goodea atripinnis]|uniref:Uncharacterized protein n=1 Tax=Goodea atripinnis TaxID=208336 RepID=A0ABV0NRY1_9TELE